MDNSSKKTKSRSKSSSQGTESKATKRENQSTQSNATKKSDDQLKYEIANEFGVSLGADATARQNGSVGGEITRRLVKMAQSNKGSSK